MAPTKLKIKGNKAFSLLSTIDNDEDLSKTWRLMTKVKDALEYGMRLENLSWRLWFMHHLMVHDQKTRNQFKKLSSATTKKLEIEKATQLKDLPVPSYRPKSQDTVTEKKGKKKSTKKLSTPVMQSKKDDENVAAVTSITESTIEIDEMGHDVGHDDTDEVLTSMNDGGSLDIWTDVHNRNLYSLRQYTSDQDPFQVVSLPSVFDRINAQAILHPNHQPIMQLDLDQMIGVYNISPEPSEPNSPTMEWYDNNILPPDTITQQTSSLQFPMSSSLSSGIHGAVYVPRTTGSSPVNTASINSSLIASMSNSVNGLSNDNNLLNGVSNSGIIYMNQYTSEQPTSTNSSISSGHGTSSKIPSISTSTSSSMDSSTMATRTPSSLTSSAESKPKKAHSNGEQQCFNCGVTSTPLWRRSANDELLCNACGLYLKLHKMDRPKTMKPHIVRKDARDDEAAQPVCSNCSTMTTPLWRRDEEGQTLCNACGL
ncbi:23654_t:CDS:2 [Cetraspora pellucida]|uniref:23654_t:CDS:1 n=1 Tax=Cetraspora pellucida TaxID=1433469 RepID=A0A9N9EHS7_9GLOM|nr:23654_t:CDS:2 [Cetraspora pellucida]